MLPLIPKYDALLLANHGAVSYGGDVYQAYFRMETMEHYARIALVAELLGGAKALPRREVDKLLDARARYGVKARDTGEPGRPVACDDAAQGGESKLYVTRGELIALVDEALKARGLA
jgi:L-fuculose-phosphate aldolase